MPTALHRFLVTPGGQRADRLVADRCGAGRRTVKSWFEDRLVLVDGRVARASDLLAAGSEVVVLTGDATAPGSSPAQPGLRLDFQPDLRIVLEDDRHIVIAKPAGMHCERGRSGESVAEWMEQRYGDRSCIGERAAEAGLVHRLDRDTSGVLLAARTSRDYVRLRRAFREGRSVKQYLAIVGGRVGSPLRIDIPLARRAGRMTAATAHDRPLPASTFIEPLELGKDWSLVLATIASGAMHQVRVHLALEGFPLVGDELYGGRLLPRCGRKGQLLHALRIQVEGELDVTVPAPDDFAAALATLRSGAD